MILVVNLKLKIKHLDIHLYLIAAKNLPLWSIQTTELCPTAGNKIEIVDSYKYLGVYFSSNGSFYKARSHLVSQARKTMYLLYKRIDNLHSPIDLQLKLFDHTLSPILSYGSDLWSYGNTDIIEKVHIEFLKKITNSRKSTPAYMLYAELGIL